MSKNETPMTLWYWEQVGGTLIEEFRMVAKGRTNERRAADGLIILGGEKVRMPVGSKVNIEGKDVIVIQTKEKSLGMYLMGQALFSRDLVAKYHKPRSVIAVALCTKTDSILQELLEAHEGCKVVVYGEKRLVSRIYESPSKE
jgi:hypothetical protein